MTKNVGALPGLSSEARRGQLRRLAILRSEDSRLLRLNKMAQLWPESMERRLIYGRDVPDYRATTILLQEVPLVQLVFGDYVLDRERRELSRGSEQIALEPQVLDVLIHLVQNRDRVVTKDDLIACVWDGRIVSDSTLTSRVNAARRAVGDSGDRQEVIKTYARKGFRFLGE